MQRHLKSDSGGEPGACDVAIRQLPNMESGGGVGETPTRGDICPFEVHVGDSTELRMAADGASVARICFCSPSRFIGGPVKVLSKWVVKVVKVGQELQQGWFL